MMIRRSVVSCQFSVVSKSKQGLAPMNTNTNKKGFPKKETEKDKHL